MPDGGDIAGKWGAVWTAERDALLTRLWAQGIPPDVVLWRLNELDGAPVSSTEAVSTRAKRIEVRRPPQGQGVPTPKRGGPQPKLAEREAVLTLARQGHPRAAIVERTGLTDGAVAAHLHTLRRLGHLPRPGVGSGRAWTLEDDRALAAALRGGASRAQAADAIGRTAASVETRISQMAGTVAEFLEMFSPRTAPRTTRAAPEPVKLDAWGLEALRQSRGKLTPAEAQREGAKEKARYEARRGVR